MAKDQEQDIVNTTGTELDILKNIEKSFFDKNPSVRKRNTLKSLKWFQKYIPQNYNRARTARMFRDKDLWRKQIKVGQMHFFQYDALHKDTLPVWDQYPLVFFFDSYRSKEGKEILLGINLHYLPPALRYVAMTSLLKHRNEKRYRKNTRLQISWEVLSSMANSHLFEHAVKAYRADHVRSTFVEIPASSWEMVTFLPLARFKKGSNQEAWRMKKKKGR